MLAVIWALLIGLIVGVLALQDPDRPRVRTMSLTLVGSFAGTLTGGAAGAAVAALTGVAPLVEIGLALGAIAGAAVVVPLSDRLTLAARR